MSFFHPVRLAGGLLMAVVLTACSGADVLPVRPTPSAATPAEALPGGTCNAANAQFLLGKTVDQRLGEEARDRAGARVVRVLRPGQMVTKEFLATRLNIDVDGAGQATRVYCG